MDNFILKDKVVVGDTVIPSLSVVKVVNCEGDVITFEYNGVRYETTFTNIISSFSLSDDEVKLAEKIYINYLTTDKDTPAESLASRAILDSKVFNLVVRKLKD